jgi:transcriptional regulator with GAF, ATPase, and Fis domain
MSLDVTALRLAEHERRTTAARLQAAVDVAALGFYLVTDRGEKADLDDRTRDLLGIPPGMETGIHAFWLAHVHPDDAARLGEISRQVLTMHVDRASAEYRYLHPTRGLAWYSHSIRAFELDKAGEVTTIAGVIQDITERKRGEEKLATAYADVQRLREQLERENIYLRQETTVLKGHASIVGRSPAIRHALMEIEQVAATDSTVLLLGETGTGKELFAAAIHNLSPRRDRLMVRVNCAAIPVTLIESELFGRERGAYTGALAKQIGRFEMANGSTIFLDEIGDLSMDIQVKLLRVLQERQIERLGNPKPVPVDLRIITATNRDLEQEVRKGRFREDLYYRLNVFPVRVPPLRDRLEDLALLVESLVGELAGRMGKRIEAVSQASLDRLRRHSWPGNVRELRNVIERAMILAQAPVLEIEVPGVSRQAEASASQPGTGGIDRERLLSVLHQTGWRIRGTNGAAERLCLKATTLEARMARLGIKRP